MIVEFDKSFDKSLDKIKDQSLFAKIDKVITLLESAKSLIEVANVKKMSGFRNYYRLRIGLYRIGIEQISKTTIRFIVVAHRKDIYKLFP